jgi:hypothetical protein
MTEHDSRRTQDEVRFTQTIESTDFGAFQKLAILVRQD